MKYISTKMLIESNLEKRCIFDLTRSGASAHGDLSKAFAICRSSMQKAHNYKTGTETLTAKGQKKNKSSFSKAQNKAKIAGYKQVLKQARK